MFFTASIRPGTHIDQMWKGHGRIAGEVNGVLFVKRGARFYSDTLTPAQVSALDGHNCVDLEAQGLDPTGVAAVAAEPAEIAPEFRRGKAKPARK